MFSTGRESAHRFKDSTRARRYSAKVPLRDKFGLVALLTAFALFLFMVVIGNSDARNRRLQMVLLAAMFAAPAALFSW